MCPDIFYKNRQIYMARDKRDWFSVVGMVLHSNRKQYYPLLYLNKNHNCLLGTKMLTLLKVIWKVFPLQVNKLKNWYVHRSYWFNWRLWQLKRNLKDTGKYCSQRGRHSGKETDKVVMSVFTTLSTCIRQDPSNFSPQFKTKMTDLPCPTNF